MVKLPVLIEPIAENGYKASMTSPFEYATEGATPDEAVQKLKQHIQNRLNNGAELISLEVPRTDNLWVRIEGVYKDDPLFDEWREAIAEYRRQKDLEAEESGACSSWTRTRCPFMNVATRSCPPPLERLPDLNNLWL